MQDVITNERPVVGYAQPLSRLQVSWGAILAGAITALAVALILWMLALAIICTAMRPTFGSLEGGLLAAWITGMVCTLVGAFAGGALAGYLPGNPRRLITLTHGFLAWCTAFLLATAVNVAALGGAARAATGAIVTTATTAVQTTGAAVGGAVSGSASLSRKASDVLTSLGYSQDEAAQIVRSAQGDLQRVLRGARPGPSTEEAAVSVRGALDTLLSAAAVGAWLAFATWALSAVMSVAGAAWMVKKVRLVPARELASDGQRLPPHPPLRPSPQVR